MFYPLPPTERPTPTKKKSFKEAYASVNIYIILHYIILLRKSFKTDQDAYSTYKD